jgi:2-methylcitrate dehydratase PrpD
MKFKTDFRLEEFVLTTEWEDFPLDVQRRAITCSVDLFNALILGSRSKPFEIGRKVAAEIFSAGDVAILGAKEHLSVIGAATAMGHASNAYDIDDGHNIIRAHPGTSFIGGILATAYKENSSYRDFLTALVHAYEVTIRMGRAVMDFYQFAHSSGSFGPAGIVTGVAKLKDYTKEKLQNAMGIAEFHAPLVPGIRSVAYPSMSKDGVPFGVMIGMLSIAEAESGFTANKHLLEADKYQYLVDDLGVNYEIMNLYFKPYSCCRWAHPAIEAVLQVMKKERLTYEDIDSLTLYTFEKAIQLSKGIPTDADEAQYNIAYPVAAAILWGDVGMDQLKKEAFRDPRIPRIMDKLKYKVDSEMENVFPEQRKCRAEVLTNDNRIIHSSICEPRGESKENIDLSWVSEKFRRMSISLLTEVEQNNILELLGESKTGTIREIVDTINTYLLK